jgi:Fur family ferric uptake transcriptional regulator
VVHSVERIVGELRQRGHRITPQRVAILEEIMGAEGHLTPQALARDVQRRVPGVDVSTIYRTLALLESIDVVRHSHQEEGAAYHRVGEGDHVHLSCSRCGAQDDMPADLAKRLKGLIAKYHGFEPDLTHFAIAGLCASCRESGAPKARASTN